MFAIDKVEKIIDSYVKNDSKEMIRVLEEERKRAEIKGLVNISRKLRKLIARVPNKQSQYVQSSGDRGFYSFEKNELFNEYVSNTSLEEVILELPLQKALVNFLHEWENYEELVKNKIYPTNKLIFYGPPGTGKTKLANAIANKLDIPLVVIKLDELISSFLGKTGKNIREVFQLAESKQVVIFLDEIDTIAKHRDDDKELGELKRVVTVLLQNIDSFPSTSILIGATNHESLLDSALWRRFPLKLCLGLPSELSRKKLFKLFLGNFISCIDIDLLTYMSKNLSGSEIEDICIKIKKDAILNNKGKTSTSDAVKIILENYTTLSRSQTISKKDLYKFIQLLKDEGYSYKELTKITSIPYTTLRDNVK